MTSADYLNFYRAWEFFWPPDVTWGELHEAANDSKEKGRC